MDQQQDRRQHGPNATADTGLPVIAALALVCGTISLISQQTYLGLCGRLLSMSARGLPRPEGLRRWGATLAWVAFCTLVLGWWFFACACVARGLGGRWTVGCAALVVLIAATMSSCLQV